MLCVLYVEQDLTQKGFGNIAMPLAQAYLGNLSDDCSQQWPELLKTGLQVAWRHLHQRNISDAQSVLSNMVRKMSPLVR